MNRSVFTKNPGLRYFRVRILIPVFTLLILMFPTVSSLGVDDSLNVPGVSSDRAPKQYCYNYTFADGDNLTGSLLENHHPESTGNSEEFVLYDTENNLCGPVNKKLLTALNNTIVPNPPSDMSRASGNSTLIPSLNVQSIKDDGQIYFNQLRSRNILIYGGFLPFVAIPDSNLATEDHFFNRDSVSLFLYFKKKF